MNAPACGTSRHPPYNSCRQPATAPSVRRGALRDLLTCSTSARKLLPDALCCMWSSRCPHELVPQLALQNKKVIYDSSCFATSAENASGDWHVIQNTLGAGDRLLSAVLHNLESETPTSPRNLQLRGWPGPVGRPSTTPTGFRSTTTRFFFSFPVQVLGRVFFSRQVLWPSSQARLPGMAQLHFPRRSGKTASLSPKTFFPRGLRTLFPKKIG